MAAADSLREVHSYYDDGKLLERATLRNGVLDGEVLDYSPSGELTVKAQRLGMMVGEVGTVWHDRTAGQSRFRLMKWLPHYLRWYGFALRTRLTQRPRLKPTEVPQPERASTPPTSSR